MKKKHTHKQTLTHTCKHTNTHTHTQAHTHLHTHTHSHPHTHTQHTHTHTYTHQRNTHTHTLVHLFNSDTRQLTRTTRHDVARGLMHYALSIIAFELQQTTDNLLCYKSLTKNGACGGCSWNEIMLSKALGEGTRRKPQNLLS